MPWPVTTNPLNFREAEDWFRQRVPVTPDEWDRLELHHRRRAFKIAGVSQADMIAQMHGMIDDGIREGISYDEYSDRMLESLETQWGGSVRNPSGRLETILRNAHQNAYNAGRYYQMTDPGVMQARPYWQYDALLDDTTTDICRERDGIIREATDDFWVRNFPPLHHRCRSSVRSVSRREAEAAGGETARALQKNPATGWGYRPDRDEWDPDISNYPPELQDAWKRKFGEEAPPDPGRPERTEGDALTLDDPALRDLTSRLDAWIEEDDLRSVLDNYKPIFADDPDARITLNNSINEWANTFSDSDYQGRLRQAFRAWRRGDPDSLPDSLRGVYSDVDVIMASRAARWQRRADELGIDPPKSFRVHRGALGDVFVDDVAKGWEGSSPGDIIRARTWNMSSWSMDPAGAEHFLNLDAEADGVLFQGDVPFADTFADMFVDDGVFVAQYAFEREVIVASDEDSPVRMRVEDVRVQLDGRTYGYDERDTFLQAWRKKRGK
jgi:SPP1 gp7 family putative phage head morphogenesis protein